MDAFPVAPETMQAFPIGALSLLVSVASSVAAQHGVESARQLCVELATNNELWAYIARRLGTRIDIIAGDARPGTELAAFEARGAAASAKGLGKHLELAGEPLILAAMPGGDDGLVRQPEVSELEATRAELGAQPVQRRTDARKPKTRHRPKTNGTGR